jgi:hypothetical protein
MAAAQWYEALHTANPRFRVGTRKRDITGCEFVYGTGVTSNAKGKFVVFNDQTYTPVLITNAPLTGEVAISLSANLSATTNKLQVPTTVNWSWYLIYGSTKSLPNLSGLAQIDTGSADKVALSANSATAGRVQGDAVHAGKMISGAWAQGISATNLGDALLNYPSIAGVSLA